MKTIELPRHMARPDCFCRAMNRSFKVEAKGEVAEISIYDEISPWGVTAKQVRQELEAAKDAKHLVVNLNSPGGDVFDGIAIYNDLVAHPADVLVRVTGLAASAASIIAMAGDRIEMAMNGFIMVHNAWALAIGDKQVMLDMAGVLNGIDDALRRTYAERTGNSLGDITSWMNSETWMNADEAVKNGFADGTLDEEGGDAKALFDLSMVFSAVPAPLKRQIEDGLRDAGYSSREAKTAIARGFDSLRPRDAATPKERDVPDGLSVLEKLADRLAA